MARKSIPLTVGILLFALSILTPSILAKSSEKPPPVYKDPSKPIEDRIKDLLSKMTLEEKIGQMTQIDRQEATPEVMKKYSIGSVLNGGGSAPKLNATESRIDDAATRILRVKFAMGIFEDPVGDDSFMSKFGGKEHRDVAREAVRKSLVLLKNGKKGDKPLLPLPKKADKILVAGTHADNLGYQCGGWTITWQGGSGNNYTSGTTIIAGINKTVDSSTKVEFKEYPDSKTVKSGKYSYAIVVTGEHPYAETIGDSNNLTIPDPGPSTIKNVCGAVKCVVVIISGRPVIIDPFLDDMDAVVAAWLPGTEGDGVAEVLFGDYGFSGKLGMTWLKNVKQLPMNNGDKGYDPLFKFDYGLTTNGGKDKAQAPSSPPSKASSPSKAPSPKAQAPSPPKAPAPSSTKGQAPSSSKAKAPSSPKAKAPSPK